MKGVSIITPVYNAAPYLASTIHSVLAQAFTDFEWIIVNDGSTDDTSRLLAKIEDPRVAIITQDNRGVSAARNAALNVAKGNYITFLDADDVLPASSLEVRVNYLERNPGVGIVDGVVSYRDATMRIERRRHVPSSSIEPLFPRLAALDESYFAGAIYALRRQHVDGVRFDESLTHGEGPYVLPRDRIENGPHLRVSARRSLPLQNWSWVCDDQSGWTGAWLPVVPLFSCASIQSF